ncbi:hypothetical protein L3X38_042054 [Prunus dulcis]|uniref:RNase H type-1 domain-containing protein n=1 Tax=Prunus dulcis TaxID=3755 RepID=A0AAD4YKY8_PRUDU|nr:hypothetical protein L3X38_042054 [Prunus dulcis]
MFAWSPSDMPGIDPDIICHRLHVNPASKPVVQKRRNFAPERVAIIEAEIDKLLAAGFIEEVSYSEWLANVVLVAKQEKGKWRVCVDYTDLNKACPKDNFPLPRIDQLVDSTSGNQLLSFMNAYSGYNQIMMYDDDKAKTSVIIERGTYCYKVMPFGLKNAGATYQRLVNKIFKEQIGRTMEVYVDDMLVKAPKRGDHLKNLTEAFSLLRQYRMKLNPSKCTFGVSSSRFLGYLVTEREFTPLAEEEKLFSKKKESPRADKSSVEPDQPRDRWQLRVDGASNQKGAGVGVVIVTPDGTLLEQAITLGFPASNNEAEYEALLVGLCLAKELSIKKLAIYSDSQLITSQASGEYMAKHPRMILRFISVKHLDQPSIEEVEQPDLMQIEEDPSWKNPIIDYLVNENLPKEKSEAKKT